MTVGEVIRQTDQIKPNAFCLGQKARWLGDVESQIWTEVLLQSAGDWDGGMYSSRRLLLPGPWRRLYDAYLAAMIDLGNGEYTKYANGMSLYNGWLQEFAAWYAQRFRPADRAAFWVRQGSAACHGTTAETGLPRGYGLLAAVCRVTEAFDGGASLSLGLGSDGEALLRKVDIIPGEAGVYRQLRLVLPGSGERRVRAVMESEETPTAGQAEFYLLLQPGAEV